MVTQKSLVMGMLGVWLCSGLIPSAVSAAESATPVHQAAGEIVWLDTQLGRLQLNSDRPHGARATAEYRITQQDTRVTDRLDKQFLAIKDLRAGQQITIESQANGQEQLATKITVEPSSAPLFQQAEGTIESIDTTPGTFTLKETSTGGVPMASSFVFDPQGLVVMESPSLQPVRLEVKPGDFVRVDYVVKNDTRYARSMMRYAVVPASAANTTTTTTTSTTTTTP